MKVVMKPGSPGYLKFVTVDIEDVRVRYRDALRVKKVRDSPIGRITEMESTGEKDTRYVDVTWDKEKALDQRGCAMSSNGLSYLPTGASKMKERARRLTADDELAIDALDAQIRTLVTQITAARQERADLVAKAWRRAAMLSPNALTDRIG